MFGNDMEKNEFVKLGDHSELFYCPPWDYCLNEHHVKVDVLTQEPWRAVKTAVVSSIFGIL